MMGEGVNTLSTFFFIDAFPYFQPENIEELLKGKIIFINSKVIKFVDQIQIICISSSEKGTQKG